MKYIEFYLITFVCTEVLLGSKVANRGKERDEREEKPRLKLSSCLSVEKFDIESDKHFICMSDVVLVLEDFRTECAAELDCRLCVREDRERVVV